MTRDQLVAHLTLHGWVPIVNGAGERGIRQAGAAAGGFLVWWPDALEGYGSGPQILKLTDHANVKSTIREVPSWDTHGLDDLEALAPYAQKEHA